MAEVVANQTTSEEKVSNEETTLKYLDFVQDGALYALYLLASFYEFAKACSGQLKPGLETVEGTVKSVVSPVLSKYHDIPSNLLKFADQQMDKFIGELEGRVPSVIKQGLMAAQKAPEVARAVVTEVQRSGVKDRAVDIAKTVYVTYEPVAESYAVKAWRFLNELPLFPQVAGIMVPTAAHWAEKYNEAVTSAAGRGYTLSDYMPMVPIERIAKVFESSAYEPCFPSEEEGQRDALAE